ncbi:MAG TPA: hypothetical protein H9736_07400 [Candidatus Anaerotruncus excrementipullorum]|uniref:YbbR domain-containing protein n=1 Tax=Candidatus Anaerotruncus excrementipullorum TaxID=2838465 RepID=A0A9D2B8G8_9FIRM|nr:hypothetical protein [Candidatus Anaerotruncus excrementipullorum]
MKKLDLGKLFDDKRFLIVFSLVMAVLSWLVVVSSVDRNVSAQIRNVQVDLAQAEREVLLPLNLTIVDGRSATATVAIEGDRSVVGGVGPADIDIQADLSGITGPGTYEVTLYGNRTLNYNVGDRYGKGFRLQSIDPISPATLEIQVARLTSRRFDLTADIDGLQVPEDYVGMDTVLNPRTITVTGPESAINRIDRCVVSAQFTEPLTGSRTISSPIVLYDVEGNVLDQELLTLDTDTADITIPVYKKKSMALSFDYTNVPSGLPLSQIDDRLSVASIQVAGPEDVVDSYDRLDLGFINFSEVTPENSIFLFDVDSVLPTGCVNLSDVHTVSVEVNMSGMTQANFTIPGENIRVVNVPINYTATVETPSISGVHVVGSQQALETLMGSDLVATVDLSDRDVVPGPFSLPVKISAPGKGLVWAIGEYTAVVTIQER